MHYSPVVGEDDDDGDKPLKCPLSIAGEMHGRHIGFDFHVLSFQVVP